MTVRFARAFLTSTAAAFAVTSVACEPADEGADTAAAGADNGWEMAGFDTPESVRYDETQDVYFVSNINGNPSAADGNGYIARIDPDSAGQMTRFIAGGENNVTLNAPKGMAIGGDTLWVADIDALRGFDKRTGAPLATIDFAARGAQFLNDVAIGPDGAIYITDTGIRFDAQGNMTAPGPQRVYRVGPNRQISVALQGNMLGNPNGITWDAANGRFIVVAFGDTNIFAWQPGAASPNVIASGPGELDGVEILGDGRIVVSSWADSSLHVVSGDSTVQLRGGLPSPADIGLDTRRNRILVPLFMENRVVAVAP